MKRVNTSEAISASAVSGLAERRLDWRHKAVPATANGTTHADFLAAKHTLADLQTPLLTLDAGALRANADRLADWCRDHGVLLAPHGKTTMSPQLWSRAAQTEVPGALRWRTSHSSAWPASSA